MKFRNRHRIMLILTTIIMFTCIFVHSQAEIPDEIELKNSTMIYNASGENFQTYTETIISPVENFQYKMTLMNRKFNNETKTTTDCYVIEFMDCEYSAATFKLYNENGIEITEHQPKAKIDVNKGLLCNYVKGDAEHDTSETDILLNSRDIFTIFLSYKGRPINNVSMQTTVLNRKLGMSEDVILQINCTPDEITAEQSCIHGDTLLKINEQYCLFKMNGYGICSQPSAYFATYTLFPLNELLGTNEILDGKLEYVDKNGEIFEFPEGCDAYFKISENGFDIGITAKDNSLVLTDEIIEMAKAVYLRYTDQSGKIITFYKR